MALTFDIAERRIARWMPLYHEAGAKGADALQELARERIDAIVSAPSLSLPYCVACRDFPACEGGLYCEGCQEGH